jgi:hypothetical protein
MNNTLGGRSVLIICQLCNLYVPSAIKGEFVDAMIGIIWNTNDTYRKYVAMLKTCLTKGKQIYILWKLAAVHLTYLVRKHM